MDSKFFSLTDLTITSFPHLPNTELEPCSLPDHTSVWWLDSGKVLSDILFSKKKQDIYMKNKWDILL